MLYQKLLLGERPYFVVVHQMSGFEEHRHPELELNFCLQGTYEILIDKSSYRVKKGDLTVISPMIGHGIAWNEVPDCYGLTIEVGPAFLAGNFVPFSKSEFPEPVFSLDSERYQDLRKLLEETATLSKSSSNCAELLIKGNLYKICGYFLRDFLQEKPVEPKEKRLQDIAKIEKVLELIHNRYAEPLTVEYVAEQNGYGKSNFCRVFKELTGDTFHSVLNRRRIENARYLLKQTALSVEEVAQQVGFNDAKSFCRVFKSVSGISPGVYRKSS